MRCAVYRSPGSLEVVDAPDPVPGPDDILVRITACGICGSDLHRVFHGEADPGVVLGHEYTGVVAAVGSEAAGRWKVGERIMPGGGVPAPPGGCGMPLHPPAGSRGGRSGARYTPRWQARVGMPGTTEQGGFASLKLMKWWVPGKPPQVLSDHQVACCEPLAVAVHAVQAGAPALGSTAAVLGAGPIGLFTVQCLRAAGVARILVVDPIATRRELARQHGATDLIDPAAGDTVEQLLEATGGGPDLIVECAGSAQTLDTACDAVRHGGTVVLVAVRWTPTTINPLEWCVRHVVLKTVYAYTSAEWHLAAGLLVTGRASIEGLVRDEWVRPLSDIGTAFAACRGPQAPVKPIIVP